MSKKPFVTCLDNGMTVKREDAYYSPKHRRYFSSEEAFKKWSTPDKYWNKVIGLLIELSDYPNNLKLPGYTLKRLQDDYKGIGFEAVYIALEQKRKEIEYRMTINEFENYTKKLNYILVMIRDDIPGIVKKLKYEKSREANNNVDFGFDDGVVIKDNHKGGRDLSFILGE